jgi:hypothetical protein
VSPAGGRALEAVELGLRFEAARRAALEETLGVEQLPLGEDAALRKVPAAGREILARRVYWNAWRLGRSAAQAHGEVNDPARLGELLGGCGLACVAGEWRADGARRRLERAGCAAAAELGAAACDYYREAVDGLVAGLSGALRYTRLASHGHGAMRCEDVLYSEREPAARLAPVPAAVARHCAQPLARLRALGVRVELLGLAENRLHVEIAGLHGSSCGPTRLYFDLLAEHLAKRFPALALTDASPRAVLT